MEKELTEVRSEDQKRKKQKRKKWFVRREKSNLIPVVTYHNNKDNMSISYRSIKYYV